MPAKISEIERMPKNCHFGNNCWVLNAATDYPDESHGVLSEFLSNLICSRENGDLSYQDERSGAE